MYMFMNMHTYIRVKPTLFCIRTHNIRAHVKMHTFVTNYQIPIMKKKPSLISSSALLSCVFVSLGRIRTRTLRTIF